MWVSGAYHILANMHCNMLPVPCLVPVAFIAAGCQHCMAICADHRVFGVGKNWSGQLGTGDTDRRMQLENIADGPWMGKASMVACGGHFSVILGADGALWSCGAYSSYCLGVTADNVYDVVETHDRLTPVPVLKEFFGNTPIEFIAAGPSHVVAVVDGALYTWGHNSSAQLGTGDFEPRLVPARVGGEDVFGSPVRLVSANKYHTLVLTEKRDVWAYGNAEHGRLGLCLPQSQTLSGRFVKTPKIILPSSFHDERVCSISAGCGHSAVLTEGGAMYTWGQGKINEFRYEVPSALGHVHEHSFLDIPLRVQPRCASCCSCAAHTRVPLNLLSRRVKITRSVGNTNYGIFCVLPVDHIVAFLMATHKRLGRQEQAKFLGDAFKKHATKRMCPYMHFDLLDENLLRMIICMARTTTLHKTYTAWNPVRKILGDPNV